jgi:hypothetical protein
MDTGMAEMGVYLPAAFSKDELAALDRMDAVQILLGELDRIAARPASERVADVDLLTRTPVARKANVGRAWLVTMLQAAVGRQEHAARETAIQAANASGVGAQSLALWAKVATGVAYVPPRGWLVDEQPAGSGLYRLLWIGMVGPVPVGPLVYPSAIDEHGDVQLCGRDRWGRPLEAEIGLADLEPGVIQSQRTLAESGAWMDVPGLWCAWVREILDAVDLRVPDPEPVGVDWPELADALRAITATADGAHTAIVGGHRVVVVPVALIERGLGRKVPASERRRWAEHGLIVRAPDGRFAGLARMARGAAPVRCLFLTQDALNAGAVQRAAAESAE